ncbi:MAG: DUF2207 domain-containing protein, partial [Thermoanaerobaculia bacterium]
MAARHFIVMPQVPLAIRQAYLLIGVLGLALPGLSTAQDRANRIRSFDAVLTIRADGSLDVTEELAVRLAGESTEIFRDLSLGDDGARTGEKKLDLEVLAITDEDGQPLRVEETSHDSGWTRRLRIWIPGAVDGDRHIAIRYRVVNAIHVVNAGKKPGALDEVHWNVTDHGATPIDSMHARVVLP